ncbi:MAG: TonB-dependent receptor [Burkholderiaceae bacterium]
MTSPRKGFHRHALAAAAALLLSSAAGVHAQVSTSTLRGQITQGQTAAQAGTPVVAVNKDNGNTYRTTTTADGGYVLVGLAPGRYEVRVGSGQQATDVITLQVGETATLDLSLGGAAERITIVGSLNRKDVKDSQLGTNVSRKQIEQLPQNTRNFLSSVDLAPGVAFVQATNGQVNLQSGAQNRDNINVFIDGVSQKNNILRNGASGMDSTRGNPFPQSAIAEYKVLTQNYKAEFEQVSGAAVTAITRSGTNELHGELYADRTGTNWTEKDPFQKAAEAQGVKRPDSTQTQFGGAIGGPIIADRIHYFFAYDGKNIDDSRQVVLQHADALPDAGIVPTLRAKQGNAVDPFRENLFLGKLDAQLADDQHLSFTVKVRDEADRTPEDRTLSLPDNEKNRSNNETRVDLKHEWTLGNLLSEARVGYEDYLWNPHANLAGPLIKYKYSPTSLLSDSQDVIFDGGSPDQQRRQQSGVYVSEELTWSGAKGHVVKGGVKIKDMKYKLSGTARGADIVQAVIDQTTGNPYYDGTNCLGTNLTDSGGVQHTDQCQIDRALAPASANFSNQQYGLYLQDDWSVTKQLDVSIGLRWDYETNMLNNSYVTPADRVAALYAEDVTRWGITPPEGQTYAESLAKGGINIGDYIADGHSRKAYKNAFAPRLGASYDLFGDKASIVFGGWGRSYDRTMANHALDELQKNKQAGGEIWLIRNDFKMPYADQFSIGLRQALGQWNGEIAYSDVRAKNQFVWFGGNRDANGGWATQSPIDPLWGGPNGFGTLILGDFVGETKTSSVFMKLDKPYSRESGWGFNLAYTYSDAKTTNREWTNDIFDWTYGRDTHGWNPSKDVDKHRLVASGNIDGLIPWGIQLGAKLTWASGQPRRITDCSDGWSSCVAVEGKSREFSQFDIALAKELSFPIGKFNLRTDVLNVFNTKNYGGFDDWGGGPGNPQNYLGGDNPNLGKPNAMRGPMRTIRLVLGYNF